MSIKHKTPTEKTKKYKKLFKKRVKDKCSNTSPCKSNKPCSCKTWAVERV